MISEARKLEELCTALQSLERIALDTEADSLHCYFEKLCLIQISLPNQQVLVDPLAEFSIQPLLDVLQSKTLLMHGADYDLRLMRKVGHFEAQSLFDTMIGARLLGWSELGLAPLVQRHFGVELSKASQKANWAIRPLPSQMLEYAQNDTRYLDPLMEIEERELKEKGRWNWFVESCDRLIVATQETRIKDEEKVWRISGSAALSAHAQAVLRSLWFWRDQEARNWDRPPFHVASNTSLIAIAIAATEEKKVPSLRLQGSRRKRFNEALERGLKQDPSEWPRVKRGVRTRHSPEMNKQLDRLRATRDKVAKSLELDPSIIAPRAALESFVFLNDDTHLMNWQKKLLGLESATLPPTEGMLNLGNENV